MPATRGTLRSRTHQVRQSPTPASVHRCGGGGCLVEWLTVTKPRGDLQRRLQEMVATLGGSRSAEGGVWALMSKASHCESLVGPPQVAWGFGRTWKS